MAYREKFHRKKKEAETAVPTIGLPHATNVAEVHQNGTTKSSNSAVEAGTQNLSLSMDKDTKKGVVGYASPSISVKQV